MVTSIQIGEDTLVLLKKYKSQFKAETYDEVIKKFMKLGQYGKSYQGYLGKKISRDSLLKNLRDKQDRY